MLQPTPTPGSCKTWNLAQEVFTCKTLNWSILEARGKPWLCSQLQIKQVSLEQRDVSTEGPAHRWTSCGPCSWSYRGCIPVMYSWGLMLNTSQHQHGCWQPASPLQTLAAHMCPFLALLWSRSTMQQVSSGHWSGGILTPVPWWLSPAWGGWAQHGGGGSWGHGEPRDVARTHGRDVT